MRSTRAMTARRPVCVVNCTDVCRHADSSDSLASADGTAGVRDDGKLGVGLALPDLALPECAVLALAVLADLGRVGPSPVECVADQAARVRWVKVLADEATEAKVPMAYLKVAAVVDRVTAIDHPSPTDQEDPRGASAVRVAVLAAAVSEAEALAAALARAVSVEALAVESPDRMAPTVKDSGGAVVAADSAAGLAVPVQAMMDNDRKLAADSAARAVLAEGLAARADPAIKEPRPKAVEDLAAPGVVALAVVSADLLGLTVKAPVREAVVSADLLGLTVKAPVREAVVSADQVADSDLTRKAAVRVQIAAALAEDSAELADPDHKPVRAKATSAAGLGRRRPGVADLAVAARE